MYSEEDSSNVDTPCYLPQTLISSWADAPQQNPVWSNWLTGSMMHCDVTGFTAMNERLSRLGKEGGEIMADLLNEFFDRMLRIADQWGGIHLKYGGDAMLLVFSGEDHALRSARAGLDMQEAMKDFFGLSVLGEAYDLHMRIGIHSGRFFSASIGDPEGLMHYLITGEDVNRTAQVEPMAEPDQVVVSRETADLLVGSCKLEPTEHDHIFVVTEASTPEFKQPLLDHHEAPRKILTRYLMPPIAAGKVRTKDRDHRRVSIVFISLKGLTGLLQDQGDEQTLQQANTYIRLLFTAAEKYGGYLSQSDVSEKGDTFVVLFGAPVSHGEHEKNACRFAFELNNKFNKTDLQLKHQIGINTGYVFAGETGSTRRRDYTTTGDNMNLAARLMAAAGVGNILVSANTVERLDDDFSLQKLEPIKVKGKSQLIDIYRLDKVAEDAGSSATSRKISFVGRTPELRQLDQIKRTTESGKATWTYLHGNPGIGKSQLCREYATRLKQDGWKVFTGICQFYDANNAFSAWKHPLRWLFQLESSEDEEQIWNKIDSLFDEIYPEGKIFAPLLADILTIQERSNPIINSLDLKTRREKLIQIIKRLISSSSTQQPCCLFFDNAQWIDSSSAELVREMINLEDKPISICISSQSPQPPAVMEGIAPDKTLYLEELSPDECKQLLSTNHELSPEDQDAIIQKANGNPFYLGELAANVISKGELVLPDSINDAIIMRLDELDNESKDVIRRASVIGHSFEIRTLQHLLEPTPVD